jgi:hypothetical protein
MFLLIFNYYMALYSVIFEIAKMVFRVHCANPCTARTGTVLLRDANASEMRKIVTFPSTSKSRTTDLVQQNLTLRRLDLLVSVY